MKQSEKREYMARRAKELAESGNYPDYTLIEVALRGEGFPEARQFLDDRFRRQELNEICKYAQKKQNPDAEESQCL